VPARGDLDRRERREARGWAQGAGEEHGHCVLVLGCAVFALWAAELKRFQQSGEQQRQADSQVLK
jgi:hypothetical protein